MIARNPLLQSPAYTPVYCAHGNGPYANTRRALQEIDLARMAAAPDDWRGRILPFDPPPENLAIEFPNITVWDDRWCSARQSTLLLFLLRHRDRFFDCLPSMSRIHIAIGRGDAELPEGTLCIGNCTLDRRGKGIFVPGCPPVASQFVAAVSGGPRIGPAAAGSCAMSRYGR